jgi:hypothetical protein
MRSRLILLVLAGVAASLVALPLASSASDGQRLMISERNQLSGPTSQVGTWVGAGAVNDSGSAVAEFELTPMAGKALLTGTHVLTGANGTITIQTRAWVRPFPPPTPPRAMAEGTWKMIAGTGAYAGLEARGKVYATADFTTGEITILRDGSAG